MPFLHVPCNFHFSYSREITYFTQMWLLSGMSSSHVLGQFRTHNCGITTNLTLVGFYPWMSIHVELQTIGPFTRVTANFTRVRFFTAVCLHMFKKTTIVVTFIRTHITLMWFDTSMNEFMFSENVLVSKGSVTDFTHMWLPYHIEGRLNFKKTQILGSKVEYS